MSGEALMGLTGTHNPNRFTLPVTDALCVGPAAKPFLFGGVGLASAVAAMERVTGRPCVWAAAQYLSYARPPDVVDIDVRVVVPGHSVSQARATAHVADREILTVNGAFGARDVPLTAQWAQPPAVPAPEHCPPPEPWPGEHAGNINSRIERRVAKGRFGADREVGGPAPDGQTILWARPSGGEAIDAAVVAIVADYLPGAIGHALGRNAGGNSLDNTIRFGRLVPTDWLLCDIRIHAAANGFAHGRMHIFGVDGTLIATASQSVILRVFEPPSHVG